MTTTEAERRSPPLYAQMTDGRLRVLHLPLDPDCDRLDELRSATEQILSDLLADHTAAQFTDLVGFAGQETPPDIAEFLSPERSVQELKAATADWRRPGRAHGRDTSGCIHVIVDLVRIVIADPLPTHMGGHELGAALKQAVNQALERREHDVEELLRRVRIPEIPAPDPATGSVRSRSAR